MLYRSKEAAGTVESQVGRSLPPVSYSEHAKLQFYVGSLRSTAWLVHLSGSLGVQDQRKVGRLPGADRHQLRDGGSRSRAR